MIALQLGFESLSQYCIKSHSMSFIQNELHKSTIYWVSKLEVVRVHGPDLKLTHGKPTYIK